MSNVSLETVGRLHGLSTWFHVFIYSSSEATEEYEQVGVTGRGGYFASRSACLGPVTAEVVTATFYNFPHELVERSMNGVWSRAWPEQVQAARWTAVARVLDTHVRPVMDPAAIAEATQILQRAVDGLTWPGRPLAAGNRAVLDACPDDDLVRLWQLNTIVREWRGDGHIALLVTEPLDGCECTVISYALSKGTSFLKGSRAWPQEQWSAAVERLTAGGWIEAEDAMSDEGKTRRRDLERRTNELAAPIWDGLGDDTVNRLGDILEPAVAALTGADYFARFGRPAPTE